MQVIFTGQVKKKKKKTRVALLLNFFFPYSNYTTQVRKTYLRRLRRHLLKS